MQQICSGNSVTSVLISHSIQLTIVLGRFGGEETADLRGICDPFGQCWRTGKSKGHWLAGNLEMVN